MLEIKRPNRMDFAYLYALRLEGACVILILSPDDDTFLISVMAVKILALHGYTQSGPGFQRIFHKLQSHLEKALPGVQVCLTTGVVRLRPGEKALGVSSRQSEPPASDNNIYPNDKFDPTISMHTLGTRRTIPGTRLKGL